MRSFPISTSRQPTGFSRRTTSPSTRRTRCRGLCLAAALTALPGCGTMEDFDPPVETELPFSSPGEVPTPPEWWTVLEDPALDSRIARAFAGNLSLEAGWQRLQAAEAIARRETSAFFPDLDGLARASSTRADAGGDASEDEVLLVGLSAAYEVDLWGRIRASVEAERFRVDATAADYQAAALSLSGQVALIWYRLAEAARSIRLLEEQLEANNKVLESLGNRFRGGQVQSVDILRQRQLLEATREQLLLLRSDRAVLEHQLQVLSGEAPQKTLLAQPEGLPSLPPLPETGLPAELVLRRPDLRAALFRVRAADRELAAAISNRFPRLNLTAGLTSSTEDPSELFEDWTRRIAAELIGPIIDGGERRAEVARATAVKRQLLAEFGQATLTAFQDVEDALAREARQRERIASLERQVELQTTAYEQLQVQFFNGSSDYIDVLTALTESQSLQRDLVVARRQLVEFRIALYLALAGSLNHQPTPTLP